MIVAFKVISELNHDQLEKYRKSIVNAFPEIVRKSPIISKYWDRVENYFKEYQLFLINECGFVVGFVNSIPFHWEDKLNCLPREGWDWMLIKGIEDYEHGQKPNSLGGLQIIVSKEFLGQGYSKVIINKAKQLVVDLDFDNFVIPIRPIFKSRYPYMSMTEYINYKEGDKIYDPWIRTHLKGGAKILHVCDRAMHVYGNLSFWEDLINVPISKSGKYLVEGALNPIDIDVSKNYGEYFEDNIWISYPRE